MKKNSLEKIDIQNVISMMASSSVITRCQAICEVARSNIQSSSVIETLQSLKNDPTPFWNSYLVKDFAEAALDLLSIEKYSGHRDEVDKLIKARLAFL